MQAKGRRAHAQTRACTSLPAQCTQTVPPSSERGNNIDTGSTRKTKKLQALSLRVLGDSWFQLSCSAPISHGGPASLWLLQKVSPERQAPPTFVSGVHGWSHTRDGVTCHTVDRAPTPSRPAVPEHTCTLTHAPSSSCAPSTPAHVSTPTYAHTSAHGFLCDVRVRLTWDESSSCNPRPF